MNRLAFTLAFGMAAFSAFAQAPFTIVRPKDGSKVRETVRILIPKNSVPPGGAQTGGYIGIFIGGKFVEATVPPVDKTGKYYEYDLDSKRFPDGKLTVEAVLYVDYQDKPRIVDRTSVEVTVANTADSKIPDKGLLLRYKWTPGTETVYDYSARQIFDISDSKKNALGGKPIETTSSITKYRVMYAVDNAYSDGSGLVRVQALPDKGSDSAFVPTAEAPQGERIYVDQMSPVYMHLSSTGLELWGSYPLAIPLEGSAGEPAHTDFFTVDPLPTLPFDPVKIGGVPWTSRFQDGKVPDEDKLMTSSDFVHRQEARGEFKGVEWEMGHPCAVIENSLAVGQKSVESAKLEKAGRSFTGNKKSEVETIWFALDKRQIIKIVRKLTFDQEVATANRGFSGGVQSDGPPPGTMGRPDGNGPGRNSNELMPPPTGLDAQSPRGFSPGGNKMERNRGNSGNTGGTKTSGAPASTTFIRVTIEETYVLEQ